MEGRGGVGGAGTASLPDQDARQLLCRNPEKDEKYVSGSRSGKSPPDRSDQSVRKVEVREGKHSKPAGSLTSACQENVFYLNRSRQEQKYSAGLDCAVRDMTTPTEEDWEEWTTSEGSGSTISVLHSEIVKESKEDFQPSRSFDYLDSKVEKTGPEEVLVAEVQSDFKAFPSDEPFSMSTRTTSISIYETERMSSNQRRSIADTSNKKDIRQKENSLTRPKELSREHRHMPAQPETEFKFASSLRKERSPSRYPAIDTYLGLTALGEEEGGAGAEAGHYSKWERELRREEEMARCLMFVFYPKKYSCCLFSLVLQ